ncbi:unnamed protein product [Adineta ricciae]|uniref:NAD(P)(+)--arginine ADP-ribosyltransferase n=1 Tax=Adineta ricciae TaxID=249248 RepID=A0A815MW81_ADIRI|nr:unnamed protein product [Adineta ricciae]CAF1423750.1 unnamed protein product [Adineta ricciae]
MSTSVLYEACRTGDIQTVEQLLSELSVHEVNRVQFNGSTCLHIASSCNHPEIVKLLLDHGAMRSTLDKDGHTAVDVAASEEITQLFPRASANTQARLQENIPPEQTFEWISAENGQYGWWYKSRIANDDVSLAVIRIMEDARFSDATNKVTMEYFLNRARKTQDPKWLIQAYTAETGLYQIINKAFAQTVSNREHFDVKNDFRAFAGVLARHGALKPYRYVGKCYRGVKLSIEDFKTNYKVDRKLLVKPFMSTSKSRAIAEHFATFTHDNMRPLPVLFIYTVPKYTLQFDDNVALDVSPMSEYPHEEEVLILPYTSLVITAINHLPSGLIEVEFDWYSFRRRFERRKKTDNV